MDEKNLEDVSNPLHLFYSELLDEESFLKSLLGYIPETSSGSSDFLLCRQYVLLRLSLTNIKLKYTKLADKNCQKLSS